MAAAELDIFGTAHGVGQSWPLGTISVGRAPHPLALRAPECSGIEFGACESAWLPIRVSLLVSFKDNCSAAVGVAGSLDTALTEDLYHSDGCNRPQ